MGKDPVRGDPTGRARREASRVRVRQRLALAGLLAAVALIPALATASDAPAPGDLDPPNADELIEAELAEQAEAEADHEAEIQTPEAIAERDASRSAYRNDDGAAALTLLEEKFGKELSTLDDDPLRQLDEAKVEGFNGRHVAVLDRGQPGGEPQLLASELPLKVNGDGDPGREAVDLSLDERGGSLEPKNDLVDLSLPASLSDGIDVGEHGINVSLVGSSAAPVRELNEHDAVYSEARTDTDLVAAPIAAGVEIFLQLRSPESPEVHELELDLPPGAELVAGELPEDGASVVRDGKQLAWISPPVATDAQGSDVAVEMTVEGNALRIEAPHREADVAYPILIDPAIQEEYRFYNETTKPPSLSEWTQWHGSGPYSKAKECPTEVPTGGELISCPGTAKVGLFVHAKKNVQIGNNGSHWHRNLYGNDSYINDAFFGHLFLRKRGDSSNAPYLVVAISDGPDDGSDSGWIATEVIHDPLSDGHVSFSRTNLCADPANNICEAGGAVFGLGRNSSGTTTLTETRQAYLGRLDLTVRDTSDPKILAGDNIQVAGATYPQTSWIRDGDFEIRNVESEDTGLGVMEIARIGPGGTDEIVKAGDPDPCTGHIAAPCPEEFDLAQPPFDYSTDVLQQGVSFIDLEARDPLEKTSTRDNNSHFPIRIDRSKPEIQTQGGLRAALGGGVGEDNVLELRVIDGYRDFEITKRSGIGAVLATADDQVLDDYDVPCTRDDGSCAYSTTDEAEGDFKSFELDPFDYADRTLDMHVEATDMVDHTETLDWTIQLPTGSAAIERLVCRVSDGAGESDCGEDFEWIDTGTVETKVFARDQQFEERNRELTDPGEDRGISAIGLRTLGGEAEVKDLPCEAGDPKLCPEYGGRTFEYGVNAQTPEGIHRLRASAADVSGLISAEDQEKEVELKVDHTEPRADFFGETTTPAGSLGPEEEIEPGASIVVPRLATYRLRIDAEDQPIAVSNSGVRSIEVLTDDDDGIEDPVRRFFAAQQCEQGSCTMERTARIRGEDLDTGNYEVEVIVTDGAGHERAETFALSVVSDATADPAEREKLGLEQYFQYDSVEAGLSGAHANVATGNVVWHKTPVINPGRGLSTVFNLTYNSLERTNLADAIGVTQGMLGPYNRLGTGVSGAVSGLTRLNEPLEGVLVPPVPAGQNATDADQLISVSFTDPDGTRHSFRPRVEEMVEECNGTALSLPVPVAYEPPPGVNLRLRRFDCVADDLIRPGGLDSLDPATVIDLQQIERAWAMTRPDGVTYFYDALGYPSSIEDRNGNVLAYTYEKAHPTLGHLAAGLSICDPTGDQRLVATVPGVCEPRVTKVIDPAGNDPGAPQGLVDQRTLEIDYYDLEDITANPTGLLVNQILGLLEAGDPGAVATLLGTTTEQVMSLGKVRTITDHAGRVTEMTYDAEGHLATVTEAAGTATDERTTTLDYEQQNQLEVGDVPQLMSVTDPRGEDTVFTYEETDLLDPEERPGRRVTEIQMRNDESRTYEYEESEAEQQDPAKRSATQVTDARNAALDPLKYTRHELDESDRPDRITDPLDRVTELGWDDDNNVERLVEAAGSADQAITAYGYDENGLLTDTADAPNGLSGEWGSFGFRHTELEYRESAGLAALRSEFGVDDDSDGFVADLTTIRRPLGNTWTFVLDQGPPYSDTELRGNVTTEIAPDDAERHISYDDHGQITEEEDEVGNRTRYPAGDYDPNGLPQIVLDPRSIAEGDNEHRWLYRYDAAGNLIQAVDPRGDTAPPAAPTDPIAPDTNPFTTTLEYDSFDQLEKETLPKDSSDLSKTVEERFIVRTYDYDKNGNQTQAVDGNEKETTRTYTEMDRLRSEVLPTTDVTRHCYDQEEGLVRTISPGGSARNVTCASGRGRATEYRLDRVGRRLAEIRESTTGASQDLITSYAFDQRDNVVGVSYPKDNTVDDGDPETDDPTVSVAEAIANASTPSKQRFAYGYDRADQLLAETEQPLDPELDLRTEYGYDANGNQVRVTDPRGFEGATDPADYTSLSVYDEVDRLVEEIDPLGGRTVYELRADGMLAAVVSPRADETTDPEDFTTRFTYDANGDLISRSEPYAAGQYGWTPAELEGMKMTIERDPVGDPVEVTDYVGNVAAARHLLNGPFDDEQQSLVAAHTFTNTFLDTGDLETTERPSYFRYSGPGQPLELAEKGRNAGSGEGELPVSEGVGDLGPVAPERLPEILPMAGKTTLDYDDEMRLTEVGVDVPDRPDPVTTIEYDDIGRMTDLFQPFHHDGLGPAQIDQHFDYDENGNLTESVDGEGHPTTTVYDEFDRPVTETAPGSNNSEEETTGFGYDENGNLLERITPLGPVWEFDYDGADRLAQKKDPTLGSAQAGETYAYDAAGNRTAVVSPRLRATASAYDALSRPVAITEGLGSPAGIEDAPERVTRYSYDAAGNRTVIDAPGAAADAASESELTDGDLSSETGAVLRHLTFMTYDGRDLPLATARPGDADSGNAQDDYRVTVSEYDANGNLRRTVNPKGVTLAPDGTLSGIPEDPGVPFVGPNDDPDPPDQNHGIPEVEQAPTHATVNEYDADDLRTGAHLPVSGPSDTRYRQRFLRDERGFVTKVEAPHKWTELGAEAATTTYTHYDTGWIASQSDPELDLTDRDGQAPQADDELDLSQTISYDYDERGNQELWKSINTEDDPTPEQREIVRKYYPSGLLEKRTGTVGSGAAETVRTHEYFYSRNRSLTRFVDTYPVEDPPPEGPDTVFETTKLCYDEAERLTVVDDDRGATGGSDADTLQVYDDDGLVTTRYTDGEWQEGNPESPCGPSDSFSDDAKRTRFSYDDLFQETASEVNHDGNPGDEPAQAPLRSFSTEYYPSGDVRERTKSNSTVETLFYDRDGTRSARVRDPASGSAGLERYQYDLNGNTTADEKGTHTYNARDHLVSWTRDPDYEQGGMVEYTVDGSGQIEFEEDAGAGTTTDYHYVGHRLDWAETTEGTATTTSSYGYDAFGNLDEVTITPEGATESEKLDYTYDAFGRRISSRSTIPGEADENADYRYDGLDRRTTEEKPVGGPTSDLGYVGLSESLANKATSGGTEPEETRTYDYTASGERLGQATQDGEQSPADAEFRDYSLDAQGSVVGLEDEQGLIDDDPIGIDGDGIDSYHYDPYGNLEAGDGGNVDDPEADLAPEAAENPFRFQGHYYDSGVRAYDMRARSYLPEIARFTGEDRYEAAGLDLTLQSDPLTQNRYVFAGGNPVSAVEWDGHYGWEVAHVRDTQGRKAARRYARKYERPVLQTWTDTEQRQITQTAQNVAAEQPPEPLLNRAAFYPLGLDRPPTIQEERLRRLETRYWELEQQALNARAAPHLETIANATPDGPGLIDVAKVVFDPTDPLDWVATAASILPGGQGAKAGKVASKIRDLARASELSAAAAKVIDRANEALRPIQAQLSAIGSRVGELRRGGTTNKAGETGVGASKANDVDDLPPTSPFGKPGPDYEWRGPRDRGSWYNPKTREYWRPDPGHGPPQGPHWDHRDAAGDRWRVYPDGRLELK